MERMNSKMENVEEFLASERLRTLKCFSGKKHYPGFSNKNKFSEWFLLQMQRQDYRCYYCETSIFDIRLLIKNGLIRDRNVGRNGTGKRGPVLEVDKKINDAGYNSENCVLACLYCNNDKSSILNDKDYKKFFGNARRNFFRFQLDKM